MDQVVECLTKISQGREVKSAESALKNLQTLPNFHTCLLEIYRSNSSDTKLRFQAIVYFKNNINMFWRRSLSTDEKQHIRQLLIQALFEPERKLAQQVLKHEDTMILIILDMLIVSMQLHYPRSQGLIIHKIGMILFRSCLKSYNKLYLLRMFRMLI